jgi:dethiobiotin synthetase
MTTLFVTGIDTGIGKTIATGLAARHFHRQGKKVLTQKLVQTGQLGFISEDILEHRRLMDIAPLPGDLPVYPPDGSLTCPYSFEYPASPHLAANLENRIVDPQVLTHTAEALQKQFDLLFLEGVGGFMTPITPCLLTADYIEERGYPVILVTSGRLGSINHTLLTVEAIQRRNLTLACLVFNQYPAINETISEDSLELFRQLCSNVVLLPQVSPDRIPDVDFSCLEHLLK